MLGFRRQTKKYTFSSLAPFQAGGPAVSSQTLIPGYRQDIAPAAVGCLPVGAKGRSFALSLALCSQDCNSVQSGRADRSQDRSVQGMERVFWPSKLTNGYQMSPFHPTPSLSG